ncbi:unnamed protein product [Leptosia nina]|uniref:Uncharacterized protein n=1 Tax=Leptosia nina TaxID=320188 RepID=A0AAV1JN32_9NEOP
MNRGEEVVWAGGYSSEDRRPAHGAGRADAALSRSSKPLRRAEGGGWRGSRARTRARTALRRWNENLDNERLEESSPVRTDLKTQKIQINKGDIQYY